MKFDCIIGNPPFNDATSTVKGTTRHIMTKKLHLQFLDRSINGVEKNGDVAIICPATKWWIGKDADKNVPEYTKKGMKRVFNASKNGPAFDGASIDNIGVFHLQPGNTKLELNEFDIGVKKPEIPLTKALTFFSNGSSTKGKAYITEDSCSDLGGKYTVWKTVTDATYTNKADLVDSKGRGSYRVIFSHNAGIGRIGVIDIASPDDYTTYSIGGFIVKSHAQAKRLKAYLESAPVVKLIKEIKNTEQNVKWVFELIDGSQFAEGA